MIGFCRVNDEASPYIAQNTYWAPLVPEPLGGIGPLGVDSRYRGKGYGLALVEEGIAELEARGMKHLVIDWTELVDFYAARLSAVEELRFDGEVVEQRCVEAGAPDGTRSGSGQ